MTETEAIRENYNLGVLAGEAREQQRIIKLLEDDFWHDLLPTQQIVLASGTYVSGRYHHAKNCHGCRFIALIKGEK